MIIDSNKGDESVTNEEIIEECVERRTEYVIPKDYVGNAAKTLESLLEFKRLVDKRDTFKAKAIPIIQFDEEAGETHADHLKNNKPFYTSHSKLAIGGLQKFDTLEQIKIVRNVRKIVGKDIELHGFGIGTSLKLILALRHNPALLDSLDMSTAERMPINGNVPEGGISLTQTDSEIPMPNGDGVTAVNGAYAKANLLKINFLLSDDLKKEKFRTAVQNKYTDQEIESVIKASSLNPSKIDWTSLPYNPKDPASRTPEGTLSITSFSADS